MEKHRNVAKHTLQRLQVDVLVLLHVTEEMLSKFRQCMDLQLEISFPMSSYLDPKFLTCSSENWQFLISTDAFAQPRQHDSI